MHTFRYFRGTPSLVDRPIKMLLPTQDNTTHQNAYICAPRMGYEPTIPVFKRPLALASLKYCTTSAIADWIALSALFRVRIRFETIKF
jgi:hypothetical protein